MAASTNAYAFLDSLTGQVYAHVVDIANPPGILSPNNAYWRSFITTQTGNPLVSVLIPVNTYNSSTPSQLASFLTNTFNTVGGVISLA